MAELLIVADDLTGATDTGVQFARGRLEVRVVLDRPGVLEDSVERASVLVVDTESRHLPAADAARRVAAVVARGRAAGIQRFFKKTDSALRGNLGSELQALLLNSGSAHLAFVPALPALGRTTRGGVQYLHGRPLHETEFAADPLDPVRESDVSELIRRRVEVPVVSVGMETLHDATGAGTAFPTSGILVFDAESDDDLDTIVAWLQRRGMLGAVAGTAALGRALANTLSGSLPDAAPFRRPASVTPMLVVGGSLNPVSLAQLDHARTRGFATVPVSSRALVGVAGEGSAEWQEPIADATHHLSQGHGVVLRCAAGRGDVERCLRLGERLGLSPQACHLRVAEITGRIVRAILSGETAPVVTVLGGDTLAGLIRALGFPALLPRWEVLPGVPVSELSGAEGRTLIISKAGGFGDENVLTQIGDAMADWRSE